MAVSEWDERQLCPDGACVGVIGPDGTCKVCGRAAPNWGDERKRGLVDLDDDEDEDEDEKGGDEDDGVADDDTHDDDDDDDDDDGDDDDGDDEPDDDPGTIRAGATLANGTGDWTTRRLCPDGSCVGLIGPGGRCKVCGRSESGEPAAETASAAAAVAAPQACAQADCTGVRGSDGLCTVCGKAVAA